MDINEIRDRRIRVLSENTAFQKLPCPSAMRECRMLEAEHGGTFFILREMPQACARSGVKLNRFAPLFFCMESSPIHGADLLRVSENASMKILFFGRRNCPASQTGRQILEAFASDLLYVESSRRGEIMPEIAKQWTGDYILSYRSFFILKEETLSRARIAAINFHPGPPKYPGSGCINFALFDRAKQFGVTAHLMNERIDNGKIIGTRLFPIEDRDTLTTLLSKTHDELARLFVDFLIGLASEPEALEKRIREEPAVARWHGVARTMADLRELQSVPPYVDDAELRRIIRATFIEGHPPYVDLHGFRFVLESDVPI